MLTSCLVLALVCGIAGGSGKCFALYIVKVYRGVPDCPSVGMDFSTQQQAYLTARPKCVAGDSSLMMNRAHVVELIVALGVWRLAISWVGPLVCRVTQHHSKDPEELMAPNRR